MGTGIDGKGKYTWNIRQAARQSAKVRQCPECNRKSAISTSYESGYIIKWCRWCDYRVERKVSDAIR